METLLARPNPPLLPSLPASAICRIPRRGLELRAAARKYSGFACKANLQNNAISRFFSRIFNFGKKNGDPNEATGVRKQGESSLALSSPQHQPGYQLVEGVVHCLYHPAVWEFDIVFIHGLNVSGSDDIWWKTWLVRGNDAECWPEKLLPRHFPTARVLALQYNSRATGTSFMRMWDKAVNVTNTLLNDPVNLGRTRPFFLVGHSMGGLLAKEILLTLDKDPHSQKQIARKCLGVVFYGTPHLGAGAADWATLIDKFVCHAFKLSPDVTEQLRLLGPKAVERNTEFNGLMDVKGIKSFDFIENLETNLGIKVRVVPEASAAPFANIASRCTVEADHFDVCKPRSDSGNDFLQFKGFIRGRLDSAGIHRPLIENVLHRENPEMRPLPVRRQQGLEGYSLEDEP